MKKCFKFLVAFAVALSILPFGACNTGAKNSEKDIQISFWDSGFGKGWMEEIVEDFSASYPEYNVIFESTVEQASAYSNMNLDSNDTTDIYFAAVVTSDYEDNYSSMEDILDYTHPNESKSIREKYNQTYLDGLKRSDGSIHQLSFNAGLCGLYYNANILNGTAYQLPNTTDELQSLIDDLSNDISSSKQGDALYGKTPLIHFQDLENGYYNYLYNTWQAQYAGVDYYNNNFWTLTDEEGNYPSKSVLLNKDDGRYQALEVLTNIVTPKTVYSQSNVVDFTTAQTRFAAGQSVMMPNGSWLAYETKGHTEVDIRMMKTPVISSIVSQCDSIVDDSMLSAVIGAIDAGELSYEDVTESDFKRIKDARMLEFSTGTQVYVIIPTYSNAAEGAKEFVKHFFSDKSTRTYATHVQGATTVNLSEGELDTSAWDGFSKNIYDIYQKAQTIVVPVAQSEIFRSGGCTGHAKNYAKTSFIQHISNPGAQKTLNQVWSEVEKSVADNWDTWFYNAGFDGIHNVGK